MVKKKRYWYFFTVSECPVCGRGETVKERRYTKKPTSSGKRYSFETDYDWCDIW